MPVNCRAAMARQHPKKAGVNRLVTFVEGNAHKNLAQLEGLVKSTWVGDCRWTAFAKYRRLIDRFTGNGLLCY